jgi:hypothetical protein
MRTKDSSGLKPSCTMDPYPPISKMVSALKSSPWSKHPIQFQTRLMGELGNASPTPLTAGRANNRLLCLLSHDTRSSSGIFFSFFIP